MLAALVEAGIVTDTGQKVNSGFVQIPICIFNHIDDYPYL